MSAERALAGVIFLVSVLLLFRLGPMAVRSWQIYAGTGKRRQMDATARAIPIPPNVADRIALLGSLGYRRVGETSLDLPVGERFAWIVAADDGESYAILATGLTGIYSAWLDGMWLSTLHPLGPVVDRPNLQARVVPTTLEAAVMSHRTALGRLKQVHGSPLRFAPWRTCSPWMRTTAFGLGGAWSAGRRRETSLRRSVSPSSQPWR